MAGEVRDNPGMARFEIDLGDGEMAIAAYRRRCDTIEFTHTEVPPAFQGQGIATRLVRAGLDAARHEGLKVIPSCRMFAAYMTKHAETHYLLAPGSQLPSGS